MPAAVREIAGVGFALALTLWVVAHLATSSGRGTMMFVDGDSMFNALFVHSWMHGEPQDWAMSPVLFLPEAAGYGILSLFGLDTRGTLLLAAIANFLALYGALRVAAGARSNVRVPVGAASAAFAAFCVLALWEGGGNRDSLELASLMAMTTYYSATVIAAVLTFGLVRRALDTGALRARLWAPLLLVAGLASLSNPLYIPWAAAPALVVLALVWLRDRRAARPLTIALVIVGGLVIGWVSRMAFSRAIVADSALYVRPTDWTASVSYYGTLVGDIARHPTGVLALVLGGALALLAVVLTVIHAREDRVGPAFLAAVAWLAPLACLIGAVALGTHAARYLQPLAFAPILSLLCLPERWMPWMKSSSSAARTWVVWVAAVIAMALGTSGALRVIAIAAPGQDESLDCVVDWVNDHDGYGAGQFWTIRAPKAYIDDPARLLQVDHRLNGYEWLVNRGDYAVGRVSFLITDSQTFPFEYPAEIASVSPAVTECGRYTILDFGSPIVSIGSH